MIHNDVLRSVRYMLDISDNKVVDIIKLGGLDVTKEDVLTYLKKDEEEGFVRCPDNVMAHFLDGLVFFKRGKDESRPPVPVELPVTNNTILITYNHYSGKPESSTSFGYFGNTIYTNQTIF